jgi:hypothetical protein
MSFQKIPLYPPFIKGEVPFPLLLKRRVREDLKKDGTAIP